MLANGHNSPLAANGTAPPAKFCHVCGDKALGFNFNAVSCESCKSFFRRNARRVDESIKCPYNNNCEITVATRRHCKRCRLEKCLAVGMRRDMLPPEDSLYTPAVDDFSKRRRTRRRQVTAKLERRSDSGSPDAETEIKLDMKPAKIPNTGSTGSSIGSTLSPTYYDATLDSADQTRLSVIVCEDINLGDTANNPYDQLSQDSADDDFCLGIEDKQRMDELDSAAQIFFAPFEHNAEGPSMMGCPQSHIREKLQRCIEFSKQIPAFQQINEHDQIALIKGGAWEMALLRSLLNYNPETEMFGPNKFGDYYQYSKNCMVMGRTLSNQLCNRFLSTLDPAWCDDKPLVLILIGCCLFTSTRPDLTDVPTIKYYEDAYRGTLYKYLLQQNRPSRARAKYQYNICQQKLDDLVALNQAKMQFLQTVAAQHGNATPIDPLLSEIFGL